MPYGNNKNPFMNFDEQDLYAEETADGGFNFSNHPDVGMDGGMDFAGMGGQTPMEFGGPEMDVSLGVDEMTGGMSGADALAAWMMQHQQQQQAGQQSGPPGQGGRGVDADAAAIDEWLRTHGGRR